MSINSAAFLLFLLVSAAAYYAVPKRWRYLVLLAASGGFYLAYSLRAACCLLFTILFTYGAAQLLAALHRRERAELDIEREDRAGVKKRGKRRRRLVLTAALVLNFATLALFKYLDSWMGTAGAFAGLFGVELRFRPLNLLLPLGISFYVFQTSGYLIDVYRGRTSAEKNLLKYALFAAWFPQMIQGPINRYDKLQPQLLAGNDFNADNLKYGVQLMIWGMLKKVFLADPLAGAVGELYGNYGQYPGAALFLGAALYCVQLYCDFSGGTDLVRGASQLFGVEMAENFRRPYFARSVDEFWRRWHISLGSWFREYLYFPLGGSRVSRGRMVFNLLIVWAATGIWHGASWNFLLWGLYWFVWITLEKLWLGNALDKIPGWLAHVYGIVIAVVGWAIFAVEDFSAMGPYLAAMFGFGAGALDADFLYYLRNYLPILSIAIAAATPLGKSLWHRLPERARLAAFPVLMLAGLVFTTAYLVDGTYNPFLYFRF